MSTNSVSPLRTGLLPVATAVFPRHAGENHGHPLVRAAAALAQGRLPYRLRGAADRLMLAMGLRYKRMKAGGLTVIVRRGEAWDENAVLRVLADRDYARPGHEIGPADTVIDIGGNIGSFALYAAQAAARGRVLVFEPDRENFDLIVRNVALNGFSHVTVERCAVSGEPGTLNLFRGAHGQLHSTTPSRLSGAEIAEAVPAITLPAIMDRFDVRRCHFLKMNCEGAEYGILYNTPPEYLKRVERIALEYHTGAGQDKAQIGGELAAYLERHGFELLEFTDFVGFDCGYIRGIRRG